MVLPHSSFILPAASLLLAARAQCRSCSLFTPGTPQRLTGVVGRAGHPWLVLWAGQQFRDGHNHGYGCSTVVLIGITCPAITVGTVIWARGYLQYHITMLGGAGDEALALEPELRGLLGLHNREADNDASLLDLLALHSHVEGPAPSRTSPADQPPGTPPLASGKPWCQSLQREGGTAVKGTVKRRVPPLRKQALMLAPDWRALTPRGLPTWRPRGAVAASAVGHCSGSTACPGGQPSG